VNVNRERDLQKKRTAVPMSPYSPPPPYPSPCRPFTLLWRHVTGLATHNDRGDATTQTLLPNEFLESTTIKELGSGWRLKGGQRSVER